MLAAFLATYVRPAVETGVQHVIKPFIKEGKTAQQTESEAAAALPSHSPMFSVHFRIGVHSAVLTVDVNWVFVRNEAVGHVEDIGVSIYNLQCRW